MPAEAHIKVTLQGTLATVERWTNTFAMDLRVASFADPVEGTASLEGMAEIIRNEYEAIWSAGLAQHVGNGSSFSGVRCTQILGTGHAWAYGEKFSTPPLAGTGPVTHPPQVACVVSLRTGLVGASGRGRIYFPATGVDMAADGKSILDASVTSILGQHVQFFNALNLIEWGGDFVGSGRIVVASDAGAGALSTVTRLLVGNVFDTQRRRRDALVETYQQSILA